MYFGTTFSLVETFRSCVFISHVQILSQPMVFSWLCLLSEDMFLETKKKENIIRYACYWSEREREAKKEEEEKSKGQSLNSSTIRLFMDSDNENLIRDCED